MKSPFSGASQESFKKGNLIYEVSHYLWLNSILLKNKVIGIVILCEIMCIIVHLLLILVKIKLY